MFVMAELSVVIVGAGQAGTQAAASLRDEGYEGRITLIGDEPGLPYERPPLSKSYLIGGIERETLNLRPSSFFTGKNIDLMTGERVTRIDRAARRVLLGSGSALGYDHLVLATGVRNRKLSVPGVELEGVMSLRTVIDADRLRTAAITASDVVIIGAGFIGLETAAALANHGLRVHVIESSSRVLGRAVTPFMANQLVQLHRAQGIQLSTEKTVARIAGNNGRVTAVHTTDGLELPADLVIVAIGAEPNTDLAADAGLEVDNGIAVDVHLLTADKTISAIGDCAAFPRSVTGSLQRLESVQNAVGHARCLAAGLAGKPGGYGALPWFWSDQGELKLQMAGRPGSCDQIVVRGDIRGPSFSVFCYHKGRLVAIESLNRMADQMVGRRLLSLAEPSLTPERAADASYDLQRHLKQMQEKAACPI
jgi:3-phenylpropionate/trans-cinnamate dioxygenase ferredoxin reductase subunit